MTEEEYRQEEVDQVLSGEPMIYERNPDTGEVRTRRRVEPVKEPIYMNEMAEAAGVTACIRHGNWRRTAPVAAVRQVKNPRALHLTRS